MQSMFYKIETKRAFFFLAFFAAVQFLNAQMQVTVFDTHVTCFGLCNGSASVTVTGGTGPYTYLWNTGQTSSTITNQCAGVREVSVTDATGALVLGWSDIKTPQQLGVTASGSDQICGLNPAGTATATPSGGTAPYAYTWSNGGTTAQITGLVAGNYTVTVTDLKGCTAVNTALVIFSDEGIWLMDSISNVRCSGETNGYLSVSPMSGNAPYTYQWSNGGTTKSISGLSPGTYSVTVTEAGGCVAIRTFVITQPAPLTLSTSTTGAACGSTGSATASAGGGNGGYSYTWSNGTTGANITGLNAGTYTVTTTDARGCQSAKTVDIQNSGSSIQATASLTTAAGCNSNGTVTATVTGGSGNYAYVWSNGGNTNAISVGTGTYIVTITDNASGCTATASTTVQAPSTSTLSAIVNTQATCSTGGSATVTITGGGAGPYTYLWDNLQTTATATNLSAGNHTVTVTNGAGCQSTASVNITQPQGPNATASVSTNATCITGGSATANVTGGATPYNYLWSGNPGNTASVSNLSAGTYTVTVTDANGCSSTASVNIQGASAPNIAISASSNATCGQGGSATAAATGGVTPYTYTWSNTQTGATVFNLSAGTYTVTVTDGNGCTKTTSVTIGLTNNGVQVGDYVWFDIDQDGFQETGELPAQGIYAMLLTAGPDGIFGTADDVTVKSDTTDANGRYLFDCVLPGTYIVMFSNLPSGFQWTAKDNVNNDCKDSDANAAGKTAAFTIVAGSQNNLCLDAGLHVFCQNVTFAGTITDDQTICEGDTPTTLVPNGPPLGGSGAFEFVWMTLDDSGMTPTWVGIPNTNSPSYNPGPLFKTSYFMRCIRRTGCVTFLESNIVTITVKPAGSPGCTQFLQNFVVSAIPNGQVAVEWSVRYEVPGLKYTVQYSTDNFQWADIYTEIGVVGGSTSQVNYMFIHKTPQMGDNYYRIMRTNIDGNAVYSNERKYSRNVEPVTVYPNPSLTTNLVKMRNNMSLTDDLTVLVFDVHGRLMSTTLLPKGQIGDLDLPLSSLAAGCYFLQVKKDDGTVLQTTELMRY
jgi:hypothetical protein